MQDLTPGQRIAERFTLTRRLAPDGDRDVWLADDSESALPVTLRFFSGLPLSIVKPEIKSELARAGRIVHPSLARCIGLFEHGNSTLLAHEFVPGGDMQLLAGRDCTSVLPVVLPLASALAYLHDLGLSHGAVDERALRLDAAGNASLNALGSAWLTQGELPVPKTDISAFGAMLERLCGAATGTPVPPTLAALFAAMRPAAQSGAEGVVDMHEVARRLTRVIDPDASDGSRARPLSGAAQGPITSRARGERTVSPTPSRANARPGISMAVALPALLLLVLAVVYVLFFLPDPSTTPTVAKSVGESASPTSPATAAQPASNDPGAAPFAAAAAAKERADAQDAAMQLLRSLVALDERGAARWAPEDYAAARLAGDEGDALYREQGFGAALARYNEGLQLAESLIGRSGEVLNNAIADGNAALAAGDGDEAKRQFDLALAVDKESPQAKAGLERAALLGAVLEKMRLGAAAEQASDLSSARDYYREASELDARYQAAGDALQRVLGQLGARNFQELMSRGFRELDAGMVDAARATFEQAARLRPGSAGPRDALAQVASRVRESDIATRRASAEAAEGNEDWAAAVATYNAILQTDNTLVFARQGLERAEQRALLATVMQRYIGEPLRMFSNDAYNEARAALAQARTVPAPGPVLTRQIKALAEHVAVARTPVVVQLQSDGLTSVTIYKIGELGRFEQQSVGLIPGRYTAVGSRSGYRDVRQEFEVLAGRSPPPVRILCEDPV